MAERPLTHRKRLGSFYTAPLVVDFLVDWGLEVSPGVCLDPSCGDGRFLLAAGCRGATTLIGCDLDGTALLAAERSLAGLTAPSVLHQSDFFLIDPERVGPVDLVVGNPPYIRYQRFTGESRARGLASALRVGARLSRLSGAWAPFLLHGLQFLRPGGAMGMVVPAELAQTTYGIETLRALCANFDRIRLLTFRHNWFEDAQQETFLLLAEGRGGSCPSAELIPLDRIQDLTRLGRDAIGESGLQLDSSADSKLGLAFLEPPTRSLVEEMMALRACVQLQAIGNLANGYVSGANAFFHCTLEDGRKRGLPKDWLLPVARNSRSLVGLIFELDDVEAAERRGVPHHLILPREGDLFVESDEALEDFVREGERSGIAARYKCRTRNPWWRVPGLSQADLFLPYMIGSEPHASLNSAHALYPNSLHGLRLSSPAAAERVALGLLTGLSLLSMELEGRSYGGGVLKLEPSEMQRVSLILPDWPYETLGQRFQETDRLIRDGDFRAATQLADQWILSEQLGLSAGDIRRLRQARDALLERRQTRSRSRPSVLHAPLPGGGAKFAEEELQALEGAAHEEHIARLHPEAIRELHEHLAVALEGDH
jgi:adenine-specific DNA methylase